MRELFFVLVVLLSLNGCKQTHCPEFPTNLLGYFPYTNGDELKFINTDNDTLILRINKNRSSDNYSFDRNCKCVCSADASFETDLSIKYPLSIVGYISITENRFELTCNFYDSNVTNDVLSYFKEDVNAFSEEIQLSLPDTIYVDNHDFNRIKSMKIIKSKGIVEFWDKKQNCNWMKIE